MADSPTSPDPDAVTDANAVIDGERMPPIDLAPVRVGKSLGLTGVIRNALMVLGPHRGGLVVVCALAVVVALLETLVLYLIAEIASALIAGDERVVLSPGPLELDLSLNELLLSGVVMLGVLAVLAIPLARASARISGRTLVRQRTRVMDAYLAESWASKAMDREGHLQELMAEYCIRSERVIEQMTIIAVSLSGVVAVCAGAVIVAPTAALLGALGLLVVAVAVRPLMRRLRSAATAFARSTRDVSAAVAQTARTSEEISAFDVGDEVARVLDAEIERSRTELKRVRFVTRLTPLVFQYAALCLVIGLVALLHAVSSSETAALGLLIVLMVRALAYLKQLQGAIQSGNEYAPYAIRLEEEIETMRSRAEHPGTVEITELAPVVLEGVGYEYVTGRPALSDIDARIEPGDTVGVIGPSGGGKTTLVQLLMRLRTPSSGRLLVGDVELGDVTAESWARLVARVPQDNKLISGTVAENIAFFRPGIGQDDIEDAARRAHVHEEILALPEGYETLIGPGARDISGGQRQRIGIARALVGRPQLLVLDEPTSALDERSEELVRVTLEELKGTTTMIIVAHRPATLQICDRILRIRTGRLDEIGVERGLESLSSAG